ncbi:kinase domain protein [Onchocerca flexuosa]|uniref:Kinase domain protein n=2 Tax=Onchocerca flexuosa TaxID=387005 RepID=A0A238C2N5_9BILA|nr:kinase domain protein [Onchocerca flexuosa]
MSTKAKRYEEERQLSLENQISTHKWLYSSIKLRYKQNHCQRSHDHHCMHHQPLQTVCNYHCYPLSSRHVLANYGYALTNCPKLGYGRYSKVCEGIHIRTSRKVAIKIIDTRKVTQEYKCKFLPREIHTWKHLRHPNLVALFAVFEEAGKVYLPMELAEKGDLLTFVQQNGAQSESTAQRWMKQLISAIYYMHMHSIAHRDLKLENILLFADNSIKIADFGFCREARNGDLSRTFCGSKSYSAPEILLGQEYLPFKADIWSLGVVAFVLVTNRMPYNERVANNSIIVEAQRNRTYRYSKKLQLSQICQSTIDTMMTFDYHTRPDIQQAMNLPWFHLPVIPMECKESGISCTTV